MPVSRAEQIEFGACGGIDLAGPFRLYGAIIRVDLVASWLLAPGVAVAQPAALGLSYTQTIEDATALLVRAANPGTVFEWSAAHEMPTS